MRCVSSLRQAFHFRVAVFVRATAPRRVRRHSRCVRPSATLKHPFCRERERSRHQPHTPSCRHNSAKRKKRRQSRKYLPARPVHLPAHYIYIYKTASPSIRPRRRRSIIASRSVRNLFIVACTLVPITAICIATNSKQHDEVWFDYSSDTRRLYMNL